MPIIRQSSRPFGGAAGMAAAIAAVLLLMTFWRIIGFVTDWFWYQEVGYETVFITTYLAQLKTGAFFGFLFFLIFYGNLFIANRLSQKTFFVIERDHHANPPAWEIEKTAMHALILSVSILFSFFAALQGASEWENYLKFFNLVPFGLPDPIFGRDAGFYVFRLPLLKSIYTWLTAVIIITAAATGLLYLLRRSFLFIPPRTWKISPAAKAHLAALAAFLFLAAAYGAWLELFDLPFTKRGVVYGAGYTDETTQIWVIWAQALVCLLTSAAILVTLRFRKYWRIPAALVAAFFLILFVGRGVYPAMIQKFKVVPNEIALERPYLERNIKFTRLAYRLDNIEDRNFAADESLTAADLRRNELTMKNIRLWDHAPLLSTYSQLQEIRTYYKFSDVDNDRYFIRGEYRQISLSPREISYPALPSRTWINEHLTYTHGYGAIMSPVNRISREGLPEFFIKDIPPVSQADIRITRPEIYYGENSNDYVFVRTKRPEFDYPVGDKNVYSTYEGKGGVPLSFFRKLLFAARFRSFTILMSDDIVPESRIIYNRIVRDRVALTVPFALLDRDPYLVVSPEGRLQWMIDGYTATDRFPYSEPVKGIGNYIRNSLKAVVDAYDGSIQIYMSDGSDPLIQAYAKIYPGLLKDMSEMPEGLKSHVRYPQGIFSIQARMFRAYHMQDPQVFYNKEDLWSIPGMSSAQGGEQVMDPYYTILKFPGEKKEEFILLLPFTPSGKDNMAAWMAARCDMPNYGQLIVYNFPKQTIVYGPKQVDARIDQDTEISRQLSLWHQRGSNVIRGNLLAIPIERSIIYVQPLYLAAEKGQLPELKRVILSFGNSISMEENLETAIQRIFGGGAPREAEIKKAVSTPEARSERQLALQALQHYRRAQEYMRQGNWASYGEELKRMDELLRTIEKGK
ncbi:MAG TPA: UPF0182 family protein [Syntrophales bacterium]|nr:UPF0182 family protein [Syntrophales bacterium]